MIYLASLKQDSHGTAAGFQSYCWCCLLLDSLVSHLGVRRPPYPCSQHSTAFGSTDFAAAFVVIEDGGTDGSGTDAGDNIIIEDGGTDGAGANAGDDLLMENVTSWVTSGFTIRDSFGNHLQTVNGVS